MNSRVRISAIILMIALAWLLCLACSSPTPSPTAALPSMQNPTPTRVLEGPTPPSVPSPTPAQDIDPSALLPNPYGSVVLHTCTVQAPGNRSPWVVAVLGYGLRPDRMGYERVELAVLDPGKQPPSSTVWMSGPTLGDRAAALQVRDLNGDGVDEVLSEQYAGASGQMLYVLGFPSGIPTWQTPSGGKFEGKDYFGETGVWLEDTDGDGLLDILASYGPAATSTDVYRWDGVRYAFSITLLNK